MSNRIQDGTGRANYAKVDGENRLLTLAISEGFSVEAARDGENYNLNTGRYNLTGDATSSAVAYLKNNEEKDLIIKKVIIILGASTGGSGDLTIELLRNPTTGTIIDNATVMDNISNRNFGSFRDLDADAYKGAEGYTITDGDVFAETVRSSGGTVVTFDADVIILPKAKSLGVRVTTQSGNSSMTISVAIIGHLFEVKN